MCSVRFYVIKWKNGAFAVKVVSVVMIKGLLHKLQKHINFSVLNLMDIFLTHQHIFLPSVHCLTITKLLLFSSSSCCGSKHLKKK